MKHYIKNLIAALVGNDPYRMELEKIKEEYEKTAERVKMLDESYYKVRERLAEASRKSAGYQSLIENLRQHLSEKDALIERMREESRNQVRECQKRIADYSDTISRLQEELNQNAAARKAQGRKSNTVRKAIKK